MGHYQETHGPTASYARIQEHLLVLHILCSGHTGLKSVLGVRASVRFERLATLWHSDSHGCQGCCPGWEHTLLPDVTTSSHSMSRGRFVPNGDQNYDYAAYHDDSSSPLRSLSSSLTTRSYVFSFARTGTGMDPALAGSFTSAAAALA